MHANDLITSLERDVFPHLGAMPLAEIDKPLLLSVLRKVEKRGAIETALVAELVDISVGGEVYVGDRDGGTLRVQTTLRF